jgi:hypothetical protein
MKRGMLVAVLCLLASLVLPANPVKAQEGIPRGLGHTPGADHWYDRQCCHDRDCEPVEPGAIRQTKEGYFIRYMTSRGYVAEGFLPHGHTGIRSSQDGREHACAPQERVVCIYIPLFM